MSERDELHFNQRLVSLIGRAVLAPSSHNTQPWRFRLHESSIDVLADFRRALPVNDPENRELTLSCACALFTLRVAAAAEGLSVQTTLLPVSREPELLAHLAFAYAPDTRDPLLELSPAIEQRHTCRTAFAARVPDERVVDHLMTAAEREGAQLTPISDAEQRRQIAEWVAEGSSVQWADVDWRRELATWLHARSAGDGLVVPVLAAPLAQLVVRTFDRGAGRGIKDRVLAEEAPLLALLSTANDDRLHWLQAGQALQRVLLQARHEGLQAGYLNQPIQVAQLRQQLASFTGCGAPQILLRLGYPKSAVAASPRRELASAIDNAWLIRRQGKLPVRKVPAAL